MYHVISKRPHFLWFRVQKIRKIFGKGYWVYCVNKTKEGRESKLVFWMKKGGRTPQINSNIKISFEYFDYGEGGDDIEMHYEA